MPDEFTISQLPTTPSFNNLDLMEIAQVDENSVTGYSSYKKTMNQIGDKINNSIEYSADLLTSNKKVIPAINEVNAKGLKDLSDTNITTPSANQILQYSSNKWQNKPFTLANLTDTTISSPSNGQVLSYDGSKWKNTSTPTTTTVAKGSTMPSGFPTPDVSRRGNVCIVNFAIQIPAGNYSNTDVLWDISPKPAVNTRCMLAFSANVNNFTNINLLTDGTIKFNGSQTVASDAWLIGQAVYLTDG